MIENLLRSSNHVKDAIVFGENRPLIGAFVSLKNPLQVDNEDWSNTRNHEIRGLLKTILAQINQQLPTYAQLYPELVEFVSDKEFLALPRSSKGEVQRRMAANRLKDKIDDLYLTFEMGNAQSEASRLTLHGDDLVFYLQNLLTGILGHQISVDSDLYASGCDSVMAIRARSAIVQV